MNHPCFATMNRSTLRAHFRFIESDSSNLRAIYFARMSWRTLALASMLANWLACSG
jgi:hypothetical protein